MIPVINHLGGGTVVKAWDQEVCSLCGLKFEPCGCSYDGHWRLTWSLTSGPVGLVEVHASWPEHHVKLKKKKIIPVIDALVTTVFSLYLLTNKSVFSLPLCQANS